MRKTQYFPFTGGENLVDPVMLMNPGELHSSLNYENNSRGGYDRVQGFERYDGQPSPSEIPKSSYPDVPSWEIAVEEARALIQPLPGIGAVRGVWVFRDNVFGFRDKDLTSGGMYVSTPSGWEEVGMNTLIEFEGGVEQINVGDTVTGVTSSATGVVASIIVTSGGWASDDAEGTLYLDRNTVTGVFQAAEGLTVGGTASATIGAATPSIPDFPAGGHYDFVNYNFYGRTDMLRMYGVNGVGNAFMCDGTNIHFIKTGTPDDTPQHIFAHKKHLFLSFPGGSIQHSALGEPLLFNAIFGAAEIAIGDECTGFGNVPGDTLAIFGKNKIDLLYGTSVADWNLKNYSIDAGAVAWSIQSINTPYFMGNRGLKTLKTTQEYGDFSMNTVSQKIKPKLIELHVQSRLNCSIRVRKKDQYRVFFSDKTILNFAFEGAKIVGITTFDLGKVFTAACSVERPTGEEALAAGDEDGYVYELDKGDSFDGDEILGLLKPIFYHFKTPANLKRFFKVMLDMQVFGHIEMEFLSEFSYNETYYPVGDSVTLDKISSAGYWDSATWEQFYWDTESLGTMYGYLTGVGRNFRMTIRSRSKNEPPHSIQGAIVHYSQKGILK